MRWLLYSDAFLEPLSALLYCDDDRRPCLSPNELSSSACFRALGPRAYLAFGSRPGRASKAVTSEPVQSVRPARPPALAASSFFRRVEFALHFGERPNVNFEKGGQLESSRPHECRGACWSQQDRDGGRPGGPHERSRACCGPHLGAGISKRKGDHFVFPSEKVGVAGNDQIVSVFDTDPSKSITSWKVSWTTARAAAGVTCRFHDLRHTAVTRLLEAGHPFAVVAEIMGWSPATSVRMAKRYGHIGDSVRRQAMTALDARKSTMSMGQTDSTLVAQPQTIQ